MKRGHFFATILSMAAAVCIFIPAWFLLSRDIAAPPFFPLAKRISMPAPSAPPPAYRPQPVVREALVGNALTYAFDAGTTISEVSEERETTSPFWWLDSGGLLYEERSVGKTIQGSLEPTQTWARAYAARNPADSDGGRHPQNIFRLVSRSRWREPTVTLTTRIMRDNLSESPNRNESNGIFIMTNYLDADNLYYAGVRVDGRAIIKKKQGGSYETLAEAPIFPGAYDRAQSPNLIPPGEWLTLKSEVEAQESGTMIRLSIARSGEESRLVLEAFDENGFPARSGSVGIRTDFMDVEFDSIRISEL